MRYFLSACFFFCAVTQMVFAEPCSDASGCKATQCCCGIPPFEGFCRNLPVEDEKCQLEDTTSVIFGYTVGPCTCTEGLNCIPDGKKKNRGTCQLPPAVPVVPAEEPAEEPAGDADDTKVAEPVADDTPAEEPAADETPAEEPAAEEPAAEEPAAEEPAAEEPAAEEPAAEEPEAEEPAAEEPAAEEPAAEEPAVEAGDSSASDSGAAAE